MICKESFVEIMDAADSYYNGDIFKAFNLLDIGENAINNIIDAMISAIDTDADPQRRANLNDFTKDCGSYIFEWLFGESELNEICKTAEELYDYILEEYKREAISIKKH